MVFFAWAGGVAAAAAAVFSSTVGVIAAVSGVLCKGWGGGAAGSYH